MTLATALSGPEPGQEVRHLAYNLFERAKVVYALMIDHDWPCFEEPLKEICVTLDLDEDCSVVGMSHDPARYRRIHESLQRNEKDLRQQDPAQMPRDCTMLIRLAAATSFRIARVLEQNPDLIDLEDELEDELEDALEEDPEDTE